MDAKDIKKQPDYVFEVSWEVCNKVGGIYTVISTKAVLMQEAYGDHFIMIGPDLYKGSGGNSDFIEGIELFKDWKEKLNLDGLKLRIGRWNNPSKSIVILIDFSPLFSKKDQIFSELWAKNQLDSLRGGWDYIEPALFGYGAGKIIESFKSFFLHQEALIIAHFHEWMTGAGILYLENNAPEIATVFTTHATVTGRSLCGSGFPFYSKFETYNGDQEAKNFNILSKHSLEKTAATLADTFTTVSPNTALECQQLLGKAVDMVTINGFDDSFVPDDNSFQIKRSSAKEKLLKVASSVMGYQVSDDSFLVATSGRYEYRNKGIDLFIEALKVLNTKEGMVRDIIAFILVPAAHTCAKKEVLQGLNTGTFQKSKEQSVLTHYLQNPDNDAIWQQIKNNGLLNDIEDKVKVIFSPIYLDGKDDIFSLSYYDLLIGFDLTVFPSYYEPFGYTPLESLAFHVPTVTTTLTGFGQDVKSTMPNHKEGILVIERSDFNDRTVIEQIANHIYKFSIKNNNEIDKARNEAFGISRFYLWKNLMQNYDTVYKLALDRYSLRLHVLEHLLEIESDTSVELADSNEPIWKSAMVQYKVPEALKNLDLLSRNFWWTWNYEAEALFSSIDTKLWGQVNHNPIALLGSLSYKRFLELERDEEFITKLNKITEKFKTYLAQDTKKSDPLVAYMCMEYGLHESLPLYSGGLGVLAGDYLKEASDRNINMVAFGLLYRYGYFNQSLTLQGEQIAQYEKQHFTQLTIEPVRDQEGNRLIMQIPFRGPIIMVQVWKVQVGRIPLYLFDTDIPQNGEQNKKITHHLYGGDKEYRFQQELVLALSTLQLMDTLSMTPDLYHYNEGHTAFTSLFRILRAVTQKNLSFEEARQFVSASTLFTTHTPVPAGQDSFSEDLLRSYQSHFSETLNIPWNRLLGLGKINIKDANEDFSMTHLAARLSGEINAVSNIHAKVTRSMIKPLWKGFLEEELQIDYISNGVHYSSWTAPLWQQLFAETFGNGFLEDPSNVKYWSLSNSILSSKIVSIKKALKTDLIKGIQDKLKRDMKSLHQNPISVYEMLNSLNENDLIIGFARRFATYKRAGLLFTNLNRLSKLVNNPLRPVKFIFAGKAHPADKAGQDLIKKIVEISATPEFFGKILFIQNYDMALARLMVQGVDLWVNTPQRGNESSGTSGMKATLNGTLNLSVMDGWWAEAYRDDAGWALPEEQMFKSGNDQDEVDAEMIYNILEHEIISEYFDVNTSGIPEKWVQRIKNAFIHIAPKFTTTRMMDDYKEKYYSKMGDYVQMLKKDDYAATRQIVNWSKKINTAWPNISVVEVQFSNGKKPLELGDKFMAEITLELNGLTPEDIKVEMIFVKKHQNGYYKIRSIEELICIDNKQNQAVYKGEATAVISGAFQYDIHFFPKNPLLKCRRNLPLVKWI